MPPSPLLGRASIERLVWPEADDRFADGDSAGIPPNAIQYWMTGTTSHSRCCTQGAFLSSDDSGRACSETVSFIRYGKAFCSREAASGGGLVALARWRAVDQWREEP